MSGLGCGSSARSSFWYDWLSCFCLCGSEAMQEEMGIHVTSHQHTYQQQWPRAPFWESCVLSLFEMTTFCQLYIPTLSIKVLHLQTFSGVYYQRSNYIIIHQLIYQSSIYRNQLRIFEFCHFCSEVIYPLDHTEYYMYLSRSVSPFVKDYTATYISIKAGI